MYSAYKRKHKVNRILLSHLHLNFNNKNKSYSARQPKIGPFADNIATLRKTVRRNYSFIFPLLTFAILFPCVINIFLLQAKALLFGGTGSGGVTQVATVIDLNTGKECDNFDTGKDPSLNWSGMSVGVLDRKYILACGGALGDANLRKTCEVLDGTTKTFQFELDQYRSANFIPFSDSVLWLTGSPVDRTTILVTKNGYIEG